MDWHGILKAGQGSWRCLPMSNVLREDLRTPEFGQRLRKDLFQVMDQLSAMGNNLSMDDYYEVKMLSSKMEFLASASRDIYYAGGYTKYEKTMEKNGDALKEIDTGIKGYEKIDF